MTEPISQPGNPANPTGQMQVQIRDDKVQTIYSNMVRLLGGPNAEELLLDFTIMSPSTERPEVMVMEVSTRVAMSYQGAKRLALSLSQAVQRYEQQFGAIELDPRRRMKQG